GDLARHDAIRRLRRARADRGPRRAGPPLRGRSVDDPRARRRGPERVRRPPQRAARQRARRAPADALCRPRRRGRRVSAHTLLPARNLTVRLKPGRGPTIHPDPLADRDTAARALGIARPTRADLDALRELHASVVELVDVLVNKRPVARAAARLTR